MDSSPKTIGRYRIQAVLGRGAMGVIYRAYDPEIDRLVAIKLIRADLLSGDDRSDYVARFRREAQAAGRCLHPNIVAIYDFALHDGNPFLAMEFVDGCSLAQARERSVRFNPDQAVLVILQVLDALSSAHKMGVVHRDIKPANILLVGDGLVKVTDFGISKFDTSDLTGDGLMIGTPSYMSPEQCLGLPIDARSDLFSTGVVLYELLCGERPFAAPSSAAVMQRLLNEAPADISAYNPGIDRALKAIVSRALAKSPTERYASAAEMATALRGVLPSQSAASVLDNTVIMSPMRGDNGVNTPPENGSAMSAAAFGRSDRTDQFDSAVLATVERTLARHLGPIAHVVLQRAVRSYATLETLCDSLAANIPDPEERDRFRAQAWAELQRSTSMQSLTVVTGVLATTAVPAIPAEELERAQKELTRYLGPIARVLVKRQSAEARSTEELWQLLARHIEREDERSDFLRCYRS